MKLSFIYISILFLVILFTPQNSYSDSYVSFKVSQPIGGEISKLCQNEFKKGKFTGNIVRCVDKIVGVGSDRILGVYVRFLSTIAYYCIIIALLFHGLKMMFGVAKNPGISILLLIKLIVVMYFCSTAGFIFLKNARTTLINYPKAISVAILAPDPMGSPILGVFKGIGIGLAGNVAPNAVMSSFFDAVDTKICEELGGGDNSVDGTTAADQSSEIICGLTSEDFSKVKLGALVAGLFGTGSMGLTVTMVVLTYLTASALVLAQFILYFTVLTIAINFLMAFAPLALACMLFEPTSRITKTWFNFLISYSLQPIIFAAFLAMFITTLDSAKKESKAVYRKISEDHNYNITFFDCFGKGLGKAKKSKADEPWKANSSEYWFGVPYKQQDACDLQVSVMEVDKGIGATIAGYGAVYDDPNDKLSKEDIESIVAVKLAMVIFMVLIASCLKAVPDMVNRMVSGGSGPMGVLSKGADKLVNADKGGSLVEGIATKGQSAFANR